MGHKNPNFQDFALRVPARMKDKNKYILENYGLQVSICFNISYSWVFSSIAAHCSGKKIGALKKLKKSWL